MAVQGWCSGTAHEKGRPKAALSCPGGDQVALGLYAAQAAAGMLPMPTSA